MPPLPTETMNSKSKSSFYQKNPWKPILRVFTRSDRTSKVLLRPHLAAPFVSKWIFASRQQPGDLVVHAKTQKHSRHYSPLFVICVGSMFNRDRKTKETQPDSPIFPKKSKQGINPQTASGGLAKNPGSMQFFFRSIKIERSKSGKSGRKAQSRATPNLSQTPLSHPILPNNSFLSMLWLVLVDPPLLLLR